MPRYYFHLLDDHVCHDEEGVDLADAEAAIAQAHRGARGIAAEQVLKGRLALHHRIVVADEQGADLATVTFAQAVAVEG